jgi:hypothetical protein
MAATAKRKITVTYYGDLGGASGHTNELAAADNNASPAQVQIVTLASGDNTITAPTSGTTPKSCTIVKPSSNAIAIKIKGAGGDTGVRLHDTDPDTVSLHSSQASFILNAAAQIEGVRLFWT